MEWKIERMKNLGDEGLNDEELRECRIMGMNAYGNKRLREWWIEWKRNEGKRLKDWEDEGLREWMIEEIKNWGNEGEGLSQWRIKGMKD